MPFDLADTRASLRQQGFDRDPVREEVFEFGSVLQRKGKRRGGAIETVDFQRSIAARFHEGHRVCRGAQSHVPYDEIFARRIHAFRDALSAHMQRARFGHRADHRMKRFAKRSGSHTPVAGLHGNDLKLLRRGGHSRTVTSHGRNPQRHALTYEC